MHDEIRLTIVQRRHCGIKFPDRQEMRMLRHFRLMAVKARQALPEPGISRRRFRSVNLRSNRASFETFPGTGLNSSDSEVDDL
jgi:hypothetical protein